MCDPPLLELRPIGSLQGSTAPILKNRRRKCSSQWENNLYSTFKYNSTFNFKWLCFFVVILIQLASVASTNEGLVLSDHIRHFEPVFFDADLLRSDHHRAKRDADHTVALDFTAHNREFRIRLRRDASVFADDVVFESTNGVVDFDLNKLYSGTLEDDDRVRVHGLVTTDGLFDGHVATPSELFYLEPAHRYVPDAPFHSVMYKASDVSFPGPARCASQQLHLRGRVQNPWLQPPKHPFHSSSIPSGEESSSSHDHPKLKAVTLSSNQLDRGEVPQTSNLVNDSGNESAQEAKRRESRLHSRTKRSPVDPHKTTCMLYLQADHLFFREEGSEEACIEKITRHVQRVNNIYTVTDFDRDGHKDNIGFMIKRIKIHTENATRDASYRFPSNYGVEKFLELFSEEDYDAFCLAYMFTYRDFEGGTLGLAWTGDLKNAGGVCEKNGHYRGSLKSLNTGIVTLLNYGKKVPPAVSHVTLAHEIGHNFGSPHDPEKDLNCTPGGEHGNYIMFARATSGDKQNNNKFSPCSLKQINNVLNSKARNSKGCFTEPQRAICGNGVIEDGEECDCGWKEDCEESCCYPMTTDASPPHIPCTLRPSKICSPSQGPCCTKDCELKQGDLCREDNGCRDASFCRGFSAFCPPSINKQNKTICGREDEFVCFKGECTGSICLAYGLESCQCKREVGDPETKSCELCCKESGEHKPCKSSFEWNANYNIPDMYAKPGTPCDEYKGYCDVFQKCREVDPSGPLATLRKILLSNESLANLHRWLAEHWYAVFFVVLALIVILVTVAKLFGRQSVKRSHKKKKKGKKKKKKKVIVHKNSADATHFLTTATAGEAIGEGVTHVVHPTVVRTNIPFKRRVNEVRRAATKAKRVARSQLGRPRKKTGAKRTDHAAGAVTSPTESEKSATNIINLKPSISPSKTREKSGGSRFSIINLRPFKPKPISPDKSKAKTYDKKRSTVAGVRSANIKGKTNRRSRSPDKKRKSVHENQPEGTAPAKSRVRSPSKRKEEDKKPSKSKRLSIPLDKAIRPPDKSRKHRAKSPERHHKIADGNWLINKFLADEEKMAKPILNGSLPGSLNGSLNSVNCSGSGSIPTVGASPILGAQRSGSSRALLPTSQHASPARGFINEAFVSSPRFPARAHSSLRVRKSISREEVQPKGLLPSKYRRSISMSAYNGQMATPDKRKRSPIDEGALEKRRRFSSPEKVNMAAFKPSCSSSKEQELAKSPVLAEEGSSDPRLLLPPLTSSSATKVQRRRSFASLPSSVAGSSASSSHASTSVSVPERLRQKLSLITSSPEGSLTSVVVPEAEVSHPAGEAASKKPRNWV